MNNHNLPICEEIRKKLLNTYSYLALCITLDILKCPGDHVVSTEPFLTLILSGYDLNNAETGVKLAQKFREK